VEKELSSLLEAVSLADTNDALVIEVTLLSGGSRISGRLISEVRYRESITEVVRRGNTADAAPSFDAVTQAARERREENARRRRDRPHSEPPELPGFVHLVAEDDGRQRIWCLPIEAVDGWSLDFLYLDEEAIASGQ
jgi:hypothetical protein